MTVGSTSGQIFDECHHSSSPPHCGRYPKHGGEDRWSRRRPRRLESFPRQPKCARVCPPPASVARARVGAALLGDTTPETINQLTETPKPTTTFVARTRFVATPLGDTTPKTINQLTETPKPTAPPTPSSPQIVEQHHGQPLTSSREKKSSSTAAASSTPSQLTGRTIAPINRSRSDANA